MGVETLGLQIRASIMGVESEHQYSIEICGWIFLRQFFYGVKIALYSLSSFKILRASLISGSLCKV